MARKNTSNYQQKFGPRKAIKYRKYAADLMLDWRRAAATESDMADDIYRAALIIRDLANRFDPPDPYDGL